MSYVPSHLEVLDKSGTVDGWPKWVDEDGKRYAVDQIKAGFAKYGQLDLDLAQRCIFDDWAGTGVSKPSNLTGVALWDARYAVTHRALLAANATQVWKLK